MKQRLDRFQKTPDVGDEKYDLEEEAAMEELLDEARNALPQRQGGPEDGGDADVENGSAEEDEASIQEMPMEVDNALVRDRPADIDFTSAEPADIEVPPHVVGTVIDIVDAASDDQPVIGNNPTQSITHADKPLRTLTSTTIELPLQTTIAEGRRPLDPASPRVDQQGYTEGFPSAVAEHRQDIGEQPARIEPRLTEGHAHTPTPAVNLISGTPQTSHDAPAGTITNLVVPQGTHHAIKPRSRSRTPVPPECPTLTQSRSRSRTPAASSGPSLAPAHVTDDRVRSKSPVNVDMDRIRGAKRKATPDEVGPHKRKKET